MIKCDDKGQKCNIEGKDNGSRRRILLNNCTCISFILERLRRTKLNWKLHSDLINNTKGVQVPKGASECGNWQLFGCVESIMETETGELFHAYCICDILTVKLSVINVFIA